MEYSYEIIQYKKRLQEALEKLNVRYIDIKDFKKFNSNEYIISVKFRAEGITGYNIVFEKNFAEEIELQKFIESIELVNKINEIGFNQVRIISIIGSKDIIFAIGEERVSLEGIESIYERDLSKYKQEFLKSISKLNNNLIESSLKFLEYADLTASNSKHINDLKYAKNVSNNILERHKLYNNKIDQYNISVRDNEIFEIDFQKIIGLLKEQDIIKKSKFIEDYMYEFSKALLRGCNINFKNQEIINEFEDIEELNYFIKELFARLIKTQNTLEKQIPKIININNELCKIIQQINNSSFTDFFGNLEKIDINKLEDPKDIIEKNVFEIKTKNKYKENKGELDYESEVFKKLQLDQSENLTEEEVIALNFYKTQLYRAFNPIINYQIKTGIDYDEVIQKHLDIAWNELKEQTESADKFRQIEFRKNSNSDNVEIPLSEKLLSKYPNFLPSKAEYSRLVLTYIPHLISALNKIVLSEDVVVYRGFNGLKTLNDNVILSTTASKEIAKDFIFRVGVENQKQGNLYRILLPKGSPVICFTSKLMGARYCDHPFRDSQKEILIDSRLFNFEYINSLIECTPEGELITFYNCVAKPKQLDLEGIKSK